MAKRLSPPFPANLSPIQPSIPATLPAAYFDSNDEHNPLTTDPSAFLTLDLDVSRLNQIHTYLWLAGRPRTARPLHQQRMIERQICITEQADLHLIWQETTIFIKPLPDYIFDHAIWNDVICANHALHASASGFLLSYIWLIRHPSDLRIAIELGLISPSITWPNWTTFTKVLLTNIDIETLETVNQRYQYGELRLPRINTIYRLTQILKPGPFLRGYANGYNRYSVFFARNFRWTILVFLYVTVVLSAMQVGLGTERLASSVAFQRASYGFAVFAVVLPLCIFGVSVGLLVGLSGYHLFASRAFSKGRERRRMLRRGK